MLMDIARVQPSLDTALYGLGGGVFAGWTARQRIPYTQGPVPTSAWPAVSIARLMTVSGTP